MGIYDYENQVTVWDFRCNDDFFVDENDALNYLHKIGKKFVIQRETGEGGYKHWQGRVSLWKIKRGPELATILLELKDTLPNWIAPTAKINHSKTAFYCMKEDTRTDGPWTEADEIKNHTAQLSLFLKLELRPYQKDILNWGNEFDMRTIDLIYDPVGNLGKSIFSEYLEFIGMAEEIPPFRMMDDIFQWVCSRPIKKMYLVDMPRGIKKDKLGDFYAGIEVIKNGVAFDKRYSGKKIRFDRPRIVIFTNRLPEFKLMSKDRWHIHEVLKDYTLKWHSPLSAMKLASDIEFDE